MGGEDGDSAEGFAVSGTISMVIWSILSWELLCPIGSGIGIDGSGASDF